MAFQSSGSEVLDLLACRTHCGLVFDRLAADERVQDYVLEGEAITLKWQGHHRSPEMEPWAVRWSNGTHHITLGLIPSPGAWAFTRCYFDQLPTPLAQALVMDVFQPFWADLEGKPWLASPAEQGDWAPGGAHSHAFHASQNLTFEFELAFSSALAASVLVRSFVRHESRVDLADMAVPCEIELGSLQLSAARIRALRTGDVVVGNVRTTSTSAHPTYSFSQLARLRGGCAMHTLALLRRHGDCWKVASVPQSTLLESPMDDDMFFPDQDSGAVNLDDGQEPQTPIDLSALKVKVEIVACRLSLSVAAIQTLRAGSVLEMAHALDYAQVDIRVGGKRYASGTLIALEGRLAVQISKIDGLHHPADSTAQRM